MAQEIEFGEDLEEGGIVLTEGPFVISKLWDTWVLQCSRRGEKCLGAPFDTIYNLLWSLGYSKGARFFIKEDAIVFCDKLNGMVKDEKIVQDECGVWVWKGEF